MVDKLGGLDDAIQYVANKVELEDYDIRVVPRAKNFIEVLTESMQGGDGDAQKLSLLTGSVPTGGSASIAELAMPYLRGMEPSRLRAVTAALTQLHILQQDQISLTMPIINLRKH